MDSLVSPDQTWLLFAFIGAGVAACIYLEQNYAWAGKTSGPVLALLGGMILSNTRLMPVSSPTYDLVDDYFVPLAIPLLLFRANVTRIFRETGTLFLAFHVAALGSLAGALLAAFIFQDSVERVPELAGIMAGSYIGGGVNFVALKNSYSVPSELTNPLLVADNFIMAGMFAMIFFLAGAKWFLCRYPHPHTQTSNSDRSQDLAAQYWRRKEVALLDLAQALAIALAVAAVSMLGSAFCKEHLDSRFLQSILGNAFVWITFLTVALTTIFSGTFGRIHGAEEIGAYLLYLFFFVIGLRADLWQVLLNVPVLFLFCLVIAGTNLVTALALGRLLNLNLEELLLSINATLGGAPSAAAMAISKGWSNLVLPGLLVGIWGYVIGTFLGIVVTEILKRLL